MPRFCLEVGFATDIGRQRERNEDSYTVFVPVIGEDNPSQLDGLLVVADGMGGERAGDRASRLAIERLSHWLVDGLYRTWPDFAGKWPLAAVLRRAVRDVSTEIYLLGENDATIRGLGSTLVVTAFADGEATIANVGDSRCYRVRGGRIERLSVDHSLVEQQVAAGLLTPEQARVHPQRNVLTRSLGDPIAPDPDLRVEALRASDLFILCSDGLTGGLEDQAILRLAEAYPDPRQLASKLVHLANERDGSDNITVVVGKVHEENDDTIEIPMPSRSELMAADRHPHSRPTPTTLAAQATAEGCFKLRYLLTALTLAVTLAIGLLAGLVAHRAIATRLYASGERHFLNNRYGEARSKFEQLLELGLDSARGQRLLDMLSRLEKASGSSTVGLTGLPEATGAPTAAESAGGAAAGSHGSR